MSRDQLVAAYVNGRMSRRTLIRRLALGGVSLGAATAYAHLLRPQPVSARLLGDLHGATLSAEIVVQDLDRVIRNGFVKVKATSTGPHGWDLFLHLYRSPEKTPWPDAVIGHLRADFAEAGTQTLKIPLAYNPPHSLAAVKRQRRRAKIGVSLRDGDDASPLALATFRR